MKFMNKLMATALLFAFVITASGLPAISNPVQAQAAVIKINKKVLSLEVDQTAVLKVSGSKKAVTWLSSDKKVATVSNKGKVKAVAAGKATVTAKVAGKKLTCKVTVTVPNPLIKDAPFAAKEVTIDKLHLIMPSDWVSPSESNTTGDLDTGLEVQFTPKDSSLKARMGLLIVNLAEEDYKYYSNYDNLKSYLTGYLTQDFFKNSWTDMLGSDLKITGFEQTDMETTYGKVFRTDMVITVGTESITIITYNFIIGNYLIEFSTIDNNNLDLEAVGDYMINTIAVK